MSESIKDGTGTQIAARVDDANRLRTLATNRSEMRHKAEVDGLAFRVFTASMSIPASEIAVMRITPAGSRHCHLQTVLVYWNGGDTNHNRALIGKMYGGMTAPSANNTAMTPLNLNLTLNTAAEVDCDIWDGVGSGMTVTNGLLVGTGYFTQGQSNLDLEGALILGPGDILGFTMQGEEAGKATLVVTFYEETDGET